MRVAQGLGVGDPTVSPLPPKTGGSGEAIPVDFAVRISEDAISTRAGLRFCPTALPTDRTGVSAVCADAPVGITVRRSREDERCETGLCASSRLDFQSRFGAMSRQTTRNTITLRGSAQIVGEFFGYAVNRCVAGSRRRVVRMERRSRRSG